jgi:hypothetical protein
MTECTNLAPRHSQETGQRAQANTVHDSLSICSTNKYARSRSRFTRKQEGLFGARAMRLQAVLVMIRLRYCNANQFIFFFCKDVISK